MGLDVSAVIEYEELNTDGMSEEAVEELFSLYQPEYFKEQLGDTLKSGMKFDYDQMEYGDGHFSCSYGRYSYFREFLASLVYDKVETPKPSYSDPDYQNKDYQHCFPHIHGMYQLEDLSLEHDFVAMIHFSDCEGVICKKYCDILYKAFLKHKDKVKGSDWEGKYLDMMECLKDVYESEKGFLHYH